MFPGSNLLKCDVLLVNVDDFIQNFMSRIFNQIVTHSFVLKVIYWNFLLQYQHICIVELNVCDVWHALGWLNYLTCWIHHL